MIPVPGSPRPSAVATSDPAPRIEPSTVCNFCGLRSTEPHGSDADCLAALRREVHQLKAVLPSELPRTA